MQKEKSINSDNSDSMAIISNLEGVNSYEIYLIAKPEFDDYMPPEFQVYNIAIDDQQFAEIMQRVAKTNHKYSQRDFKEFTHKDMQCLCYTNDEVKVYKTTPVHIHYSEPFLIIGSNKSKLTLLNFPSTTSLHQITYVKQLVFRITSRIYLNFRSSIDEITGKKVNSIYINYNHESNVDMKMVNETLKEVMDILKCE